MKLENILNLYQGTNETAPIPAGVHPTNEENAFDCDCGDWSSDWKIESNHE
ncbi:MAG: hypothetical protein J6A75_09660 [Lachnospiraceae bacterium]|nr:hypothetical protein [Lachnospiraceae bacterium]